MARSNLVSGANLVTDSGGVVFPLVQGEQLEFPVSVEFLGSLTDCTYEAVVVEALNEPGQPGIPKAVKPGGVQTTLAVRAPVLRGNWDAAQAYNANEIVRYLNSAYRLKSGVGRTYPIGPDADPLWELTSEDTLFIQFPSTLSTGWQQQPTVETPVYGYFELRITEPSTKSFPQTWKPVRGPVEIVFSPTQLVP